MTQTTVSPDRYLRRARSVADRLVPLAVVALATGGAVTITSPAKAAATPDTVQVTATHDAYTSSTRPSYTFGTNPSLVAGVKGADRMTTYLRFTVPAIPTGKTLSRAELTLTRDPAAPLPATVTINKVAGTAWTETTLTHRNAPAIGAAIATATPTANAATITVNLTPAITGPGVHTVAVTTGQPNTIARFRSTEHGATGPRLTLTHKTTPTPTPTPAPSPTPAGCTVNALLVPSCGVLWGAAAGGFSSTPRDQALREWEAASGRTATIYHTYHRGDEAFPTAAETAMTREPGKPRVLFANWKVGYGSTWANVAAGKQDARIDKLSAHIKAKYTKTFFLAIHHEPENDVNESAGSGMTASNYAAMFAHTVKRMKANGVTNVVFVMAYMNIDKWNDTSWWPRLYPGNDVVDWVAVDAYVNAQPGGYNNGDFNDLMNRTTNKTTFPGWYNWARTTRKPIMAAEWGVYDCKTACSPTEKAKLFNTVLPQLKAMTAIKALVYFDTASDQAGKDMRINSTPEALSAFKKIAADPIFNVKLT